MRKTAIPEFQWPPVGFFAECGRELIGIHELLALGGQGAQHFGGRGRQADAEDDDWVTGRHAVGARAQSPPHAEWIDNGDVRACLEQALDESFCRIGLARAGGADNRDPFIERLEGQSGRESVAAAGRNRPAASTHCGWCMRRAGSHR